MDYELPQYNLDFSKPITGDDIDENIVRDKLRKWDQVHERGILDKRNQDITKYERMKAITLLNDRTLFAYANFKFDGKPLMLRHYQDALLSDRHKRTLFCASNQIGKSITLDIDAATGFIIDHGKGWVGVLVSKSLAQSKYQMMRIKEMLSSANISYKIENTNDSKTGKMDNSLALSYTFYDNKHGKAIPKYTNLLICTPPSGSALGYPCDEMWLDEFDYWENIDQNRFIYQIAIPRTIETKGRITIYTNPDGKDKMMYQLWSEKYPDGTPVWHRYNFNYWDKPGATQEEYDMLTNGMTKQQVESTMLAIFSNSGGAFFSHQEIQDSYDDELNQVRDTIGYDKETVWFLDVGLKHDQSCLVGGYLEENKDNVDIPLVKIFFVHKYPVGYPLNRVVGVKNEVKDDGWDDYSTDNPTVESVLNDYAKKDVDEDGNVTNVWFPLFGADVTGNSGIIPLFQSIGIDPIDVTFSGKLKWAMFQRFKYYMENRCLKRAKDRDDNKVRGSDWAYQASKLIEKKPKGDMTRRTSYRQLGHESEEDLDDTMDATAGLIYLIDNPDMPSLEFALVDGFGTKRDKSDGKSIKSDDPELNGQYIPSFMKEEDVLSFRERNNMGVR